MEPTTEMIVKKIDAILCELQALRQALVEQVQPSDGKLAERLYGVLGQGTWDEYDRDLDWRRFAS